MSSPEEPLVSLAALLERAGLRTPTLLILEMFGPIDVLSSNLVRFGMPFVRGTRIEPVATALGEPDGWGELRQLLARDD